MREVRDWRRRKVAVLPAPWLFTGRVVRALRAKENVWLATRVRGAVSLRQAVSGRRVRLPLDILISKSDGDALLIDRQVILSGKDVELLALPPGYWGHTERNL